MTTRKTHHVVPSAQGWAVKKGGASRASKVFTHKRDAIDYARQVSQHQHTELLIHGADGKIQSADSHGGDPCPPKDAA
ncbi:MAG TPA: DUF2188 domain-containing protein [Chloroflexi bacterium]|nr:DUF2188 domain-containing protein [Chloroflexota bacterium]